MFVDLNPAVSVRTNKILYNTITSSCTTRFQRFAPSLIYYRSRSTSSLNSLSSSTYHVRSRFPSTLNCELLLVAGVDDSDPVPSPSGMALGSSALATPPQGASSVLPAVSAFETKAPSPEALVDVFPLVGGYLLRIQTHYARFWD